MGNIGENYNLITSYLKIVCNNFTYCTERSLVLFSCNVTCMKLRTH